MRVSKLGRHAWVGLYFTKHGPVFLQLSRSHTLTTKDERFSNGEYETRWVISVLLSWLFIIKKTSVPQVYRY